MLKTIINPFDGHADRLANVAGGNFAAVWKEIIQLGSHIAGQILERKRELHATLRQTARLIARKDSTNIGISLRTLALGVNPNSSLTLVISIGGKRILSAWGDTATWHPVALDKTVISSLFEKFTPAARL